MIPCLNVCLSVHHVHVMSTEAREGGGDPGTRVIDGCELPCGSRELKPDPLEKYIFQTPPPLLGKPPGSTEALHFQESVLGL